MDGENIEDQGTDEHQRVADLIALGSVVAVDRLAKQELRVLGRWRLEHDLAVPALGRTMKFSSVSR